MEEQAKYGQRTRIGTSELIALLREAAKEVFTMDEAAEYLGLSKSTMYKLNQSRAIPYYQPNGKTIYYDRADIIAYARTNRVASMSELHSRADRISYGLAHK